MLSAFSQSVSGITAQIDKNAEIPGRFNSVSRLKSMDFILIVRDFCKALKKFIRSYNKLKITKYSFLQNSQ